MKHNKLIVILLAILLLVGTFVSAANIGTADLRTQEENVPQQPDTTEIPEIPHITVAGLDVGDTYYELSLLVSARQFQTVGVVLSYDTSALTPIAWSSGEKDADDNPKATDLTGHTQWSNPVVLPTRGADKLSGKPALCYAAATPGEDGESEATPTGRAYLYLGADALEYTSLSSERVVTVRFRKEAGAGTITMPTEAGNAQNESLTLCLAPETSVAAVDSIPGRPVMATTKGEGVQLQSYKTYAFEAAATTSTESPEADPAQEGDAETGTETEPEPGEGNEGGSEGEDPGEPCILTFARNPRGLESADSTGGGSGDFAITFFDWDGRVIDAIAAPSDATQAVDIWQRQKWVEERLGSKKGYEFDQWLIVQQQGGSLATANGTFTSNDEALDLSDSDVEEDVATPAFLSKLEETDKTITDGPEETSKSLLLQAAYKAKTDAGKFAQEDLVNGGSSSNLDRFYTISEPTFTRLGAADKEGGAYSLTMTVTRKRDEYGVTRLRQPAIWVSMAPSSGGSNILNLIQLENTDETTFEIVTNKQISKVEYKVVDVYQVDNWRNAGDKSATMSQEKNLCVQRGTQGYLARQAYLVATTSCAWDTYVDNWAFADCFYGTNNARNTNTWWNETRINAAKTKLVAASGSGQISYDRVVQLLGEVS